MNFSCGFLLILLMSLALMNSSCSGTDITVREGENASFECSNLNTTEDSNIEFIFIEYSEERREGGGGEGLRHIGFIHQSDFTKEDINAADRFEERLKFSSIGMLTIVNTSTTDEGLFKCSSYERGFKLVSENILVLEVTPLNSVGINIESSGANVGVIVGSILSVLLILAMALFVVLKRSNMSLDQMSWSRVQKLFHRSDHRVSSSATSGRGGEEVPPKTVNNITCTTAAACITEP